MVGIDYRDNCPDYIQNVKKFENKSYKLFFGRLKKLSDCGLSGLAFGVIAIVAIVAIGGVYVVSSGSGLTVGSDVFSNVPNIISNSDPIIGHWEGSFRPSDSPSKPDFKTRTVNQTIDFFDDNTGKFAVEVIPDNPEKYGIRKAIFSNTFVWSKEQKLEGYQKDYTMSESDYVIQFDSDPEFSRDYDYEREHIPDNLESNIDNILDYLGVDAKYEYLSDDHNSAALVFSTSILLADGNFIGYDIENIDGKQCLAYRQLAYSPLFGTNPHGQNSRYEDIMSLKKENFFGGYPYKIS